MEIESFEQVEELFGSRGVKQIFVKHLSAKQDNDKNQIYLGSGKASHGFINRLPAKFALRTQSESKTKRHSDTKLYIIEASLAFEWIISENLNASAPDTKIIDYFQYPEIRMSGFLNHCKNPPDALRRQNQSRYGQRILVLGANDQEKTFGLILTELEDPVVADFPVLPFLPNSKVLKTHIIGSALESHPKDLLIGELREISGIWHPSISLRPGEVHPIHFRGNQGAGYTLEALLNVPRNALKAPDKYGFEIKSFKKGGKISLMTPTADSGQEGKLSFREFMEKYGWEGKKGDGRRVFTGLHKYKKPNLSSGCTLDILGYESATMKFVDDTKSIVVCLLRNNSDFMVSGWTFEKLLESWSKKHSSACYVEYEKRPYSGNGNEHDFEYRYTGNVHLGAGTTIFKYLMSISSQAVYYDSGHEIYADGTPKVRPQWRVSVTKKFQQTLEQLYSDVESLSIV